MVSVPTVKNSMESNSQSQERESVLELSKPLMHILGGTTVNGGIAPTQPPVSKAAARLLSKTQQQKVMTLEETTDTLKPSVSDSRLQAIHAKESELENAERARIRTSKTSVRVTLVAMKHLPKMDLFGKTDAYCLLSIDNKSAGGQEIVKKSSIARKNLNPEWSDEKSVFHLFDYPSQVMLHIGSTVA